MMLSFLSMNSLCISSSFLKNNNNNGITMLKRYTLKEKNILWVNTFRCGSFLHLFISFTVTGHEIPATLIQYFVKLSNHMKDRYTTRASVYIQHHNIVISVTLTMQCWFSFTIAWCREQKYIHWTSILKVWSHALFMREVRGELSNMLNRKATIIQILTLYNYAEWKVVSERSTCWTLRWMGYNSRRPHWFTLLSGY